MPGLRSYDRPPDPEEFEEVIDQQADQIDQPMAASAPSGASTGTRLKAFNSALDSALQALGGGFEAIKPGALADTAGPLPLELVKRSGAISEAETDFAASTGEEPTLPPIDSLTSDESLVLATTALKKLGKDRDFKRFLAEEVPEEAPIEEEVMVEEEVPVPDEQANPEIAFL